MNFNPLTLERVSSSQRLHFNYQSLQFEAIDKDKKLLQNPLTLDIYEGKKLTYEPLLGKFIVLNSGRS